MNLEDVVDSSLDITRFLMMGRNRIHAASNNDTDTPESQQDQLDSDHVDSDNDNDNDTSYLYSYNDSASEFSIELSNTDDVIINNESNQTVHDVVVQTTDTNKQNNTLNSLK